MTADVADNLFPANERTPGQAASRATYEKIAGKLRGYPWFADYESLRAEGLDWRKAVYVAWMALPTGKRQPATQEALATEILGLRSAHTISAWKRKFPELDDMIAALQASPLLKYRAEVFEALGQVASMVDPRAHQDRKLFLEMSGDYKPKAAMEVGGDGGEPIQQVHRFDVSGLPLEVLRGLANAGDAATTTDGSTLGVDAPKSD